MTPFVRATVIWANLIGMIFLISFATYVYTHDTPYLSYPNLPLPALQSAVVTGHTIPLKLERCNSATTARLYAFSARLINDDDPKAPPINLPGSLAIRLEPGCTSEVSEVNRIPMNTPAGRYHLDGLAQISTQFHSYLVPWRSQSFQVVNQ